MLALVAVAPVIRAIWLGLRSPAGVALVASEAAPDAVMAAVGVLWALALLSGSIRGPALLPPFLTHALGGGPSLRRTVFRGPMLRSELAVTVVTAASGGLVGGALVGHGADTASAVAFTAACALVGAITSVAWLAGQAMPRAAVPAALLVLGLVGVTLLLPALHPVMPWGWAASAYPSDDGLASPLPLVALAVLACALLASTPLMLDRLRHPALMSQALRWEAATAHAATMDLGAAASLYRAVPRSGRRIRAVRSGRGLVAAFLLRDAVGAIRTPGRLIAGLLALVGAGLLMTAASAWPGPVWLPGAAAGVLALLGLGPLSDGIRHAATVASDMPLYGVSDARLLLLHALLPVAALVIPGTAAAAGAATTGIGVLAPVAASLCLGLLALLVRIGSALKGALPPALLTPMPTAFGDAAAGVRLVWALDGPLLAGLGGAASAVILSAPALFAIVAIAAAASVVIRWRGRR